MSILFALPLGFLLDQLLGDPPGWPLPPSLDRPIHRHPGKAAAPWRPERLAGIVLLLIVTGTTGGLTWLMFMLAGRVHEAARLAVATVLVYYGLATAAWRDETRERCWSRVSRRNWPEARRRLSGIVGRDTHDLPPEEIYRACIETVAENTTDGSGRAAVLRRPGRTGRPVGLQGDQHAGQHGRLPQRTLPALRLGVRAGWTTWPTSCRRGCTWLLLALAALLTGQRARHGPAHRLARRPQASQSQRRLGGGNHGRGPERPAGRAEHAIQGHTLATNPTWGDRREPLTHEQGVSRVMLGLLLVGGHGCALLPGLRSVAVPKAGEEKLPATHGYRLSLPGQWMLQRQPVPVLLRAGHALRDEVHAVHAVGDVGIEALAYCRTFCPLARRTMSSKAAV